ncbi:MAG: 50S ribosomal protein L5 [Promethearchaeota archaeon]|nr:MAG: 50S ribosomal protein L5 [Candidatus Lokiarchaeota archaeon]
MASKTKQKKKPAESVNYEQKWENPMKRPYLEKIILNIGVGSGGEELERAVAVLESITGKTPCKTISRKNIKEFNLRKGRPIGVKVTIRDEDAAELLKRLLIVSNNRIKRASFDDYGNFGFGIKEHISIPGVEYDNTIGIWGLDAMGRVVRPGMRVKYRRAHRASIPKDHYVNREETQYFLQKMYNINIVEEIIDEY